MHFVEVLAEQRRIAGAHGYVTDYVLVTGADPGIRSDIVDNPQFGATYDVASDRIRCDGSSHMDVSHEMPIVLSLCDRKFRLSLLRL